MTEAEWLSCVNPALMIGWLEHSRRSRDRSPRLVRQLRQAVLDALRDRATSRVQRLFGCACCRRLWPLLAPGQKAAVEAAEWYADDADGEVRLTLDDRAVGLREALRTSLTQTRSWDGQTSAGASHRLSFAVLCQLEQTHQMSPQDGVRALAEVAAWTVTKDTAKTTAARMATLRESAMRAEEFAQCEFFRDVLGNPYRPVSCDASWLTSTVVGVAQQMYDSRDFSATPILADALQDAGCGDELLLGHCRSDGPHVRGCWVVDIILGKT